MQEYPELPSVEELLDSDRDVRLDSLGDLNVSDDAVRRTELEIRRDLHSVWPHARPDEIDRAAGAIADFYRHTLETGTINYGDARELGRRTASELRGFAITG